MGTRHLLVVAYHFPPAGGVPVRRVLRLLRRLPQHGWRASVVTANRPYDPFHPDDPDGLGAVPADVAVVRAPARAAVERALASGYRLLSGLRPARSAPEGPSDGAASDVAGGRLRRLLGERWLFPDPKRFWIAGAVRAACGHAGRDPVDLVLASGYPWSSFVVAERVGLALGRPYCLDFRDAWTLNPRRLWTGATHRERERELVEGAALVTVATDWIRDRMRERYPHARIETVTNGYDPAELPEPDPALADPDRFVLTYTGTFNDALPPSAFDQSPWWLLQAVQTLAPEVRARLRLRLVGRLGDAYRRWIAEHELGDVVECTGPVSHRRALQHQLAADALLLVVHDSPEAAAILTGKLGEYAGAGRPVLALAPAESEAAKAVVRNRLGQVVPPRDVVGIAAQLTALVRAGSGSPSDAAPGAPELSAAVQVARWARLLDAAADGAAAAAAGERAAARQSKRTSS